MEKEKLKNLNVKELIKELFKELETPKDTAQIAAFLEVEYNTAHNKIVVWMAKGWLKVIKKGRKNLYYLNQDKIEL